jgi:putative Mg2+ transporter-C (MgtC) family protein
MGNWLSEAWAALGQELIGDFPNAADVVRVFVRLTAALLLGGVLGWERGHSGKAAGFRTHILVAVGATVVILTAELTKMSPDQISRVIQGALTGIGFIGGGAILKLSVEHQIKGLTTAASIWLTSTIGIAIGAGRLGLALAATLVALLVLSVLGRFEHQLGFDDHQHGA